MNSESIEHGAYVYWGKILWHENRRPWESFSKHHTRPGRSRERERPLANLSVPPLLPRKKGSLHSPPKGHSPWPNTTPGFKMKEHRGTLSLVQEWRCCTSFVSCTASSDWDRLELPCEKHPDLALKTSKSDFNFLIKKELSPSFLGRFTQTNNHIYNWKIYIFPPPKMNSFCFSYFQQPLWNFFVW